MAPIYGAPHRKERKRWLSILEARGSVPCARCGQPIRLGDEWDLGHDDNDTTRWSGPEHARRCNRAAGGRKARANALKRTTGRSTIW